MTLSLGINSVSRQMRPDYRDQLKSLRELAMQANAEDKYGSYTAGTGIVVIALIISFFAYSITLKVFPNNLKEYFRSVNAELSDRYKPKDNNGNEPSPRDIFDILRDILTYGGIGGSACGATIVYIRKKNKAARQRAMEQALQEEMDRLKKHLEEEINDTSTSAAGVTDNKSSILSGANIVELFNSFTDVMAIQGDLPRQEEETALEYFDKVAESINFPKNESEKAARYFDDELYGKKNSTKEDKASFMKLILEMISKINKKTFKK